ncbi:NAD(+) diphosphatase [Aureimonas leprariae]|uniref:NAD(+) diphosphatase n=1 Tax=Plantimonas leprariae TaxID=2615207 RepID=UPI001FEB4F9F|nr:NAD(+) diphosphatase [Aureimonas leprariae]
MNIRTPPHLGFSGNRLRRAGEERTEATLGEALAHPAARVLLRGEGGWLSGSDGFLFPVGVAERLGGEDAVLLGTEPGGAPRLAMRIPAVGSDDGSQAQPLRALAMSGALESDLEGQLAQAEHFLNWHRRARFCGLCGGPTVAEAAGYRRRCTACNETHFPRTDPVSIMLIHDGDGSCLLGRGAHFAPGMWSCLAGFVEPGETLEDAVRREVEEEAGIAVGEVGYLTSQPWPFPGSLMLGCHGLATSRKITFDHAELEDCRWFGRHEVQEMFAERHPGGLTLPKPFAIAHHLVKAFAERRIG